MRSALHIVVLQFIVMMAFSQHYSYTIRNYKAVDGLPQSQVRVILEDKNGYLWIGTEGGGLARFDGREFKVFTTLDGLQSNIIQFLKLDSKQNLWITHPRGITKFDGLTFRKFDQHGSPKTAKTMRRMFELNDTIFFTTSQGYIGKIYNDSVYYWSRPVTSDKAILTHFVHKMPTDELMFCLSDSSFLIKNSKGNYSVTHKKIFNRFNNIFNYKNQVWLMSDSGYYVFDSKNRTFIKKSLFVKNHIVSYDSLNNVFWTRSGDNLFRESIANNVAKIDTVMKDFEVTQVLVDSEGNTWLGSNGAGLFKYFSQDFDRCSSENLKMVYAIHIDQEGASWIGSSAKGLWKIHKGKAKNYSEGKAPYRDAVFAIKESPDSVLWVGTRDGLGEYIREEDRFKWYSRLDGLSSNSIRAIEFDEYGGMWIATLGAGVNYYDGKKFHHYTTEEGLITDHCMSLHYSKRYKKLFLGNEFGLSTITNGVVSHVSIKGIENTAVMSIHPYQDSLLLVGTGGSGLIIYNPRTKCRNFITTKEGLASDFIYFVAVDERNFIWVGTEKGITRIKVDRKYNVVENLHYDYDNGLIGVETNQNAYYFKGDEKYFGLVDGLYQYNNLKQKDQRSFDLHLTAVDLWYGQFSMHEYADSAIGFFKIPHNPSLPPDKNHITFDFNRVDKQYPKSVKFKYFLEGFDKTWSLPSSNSKVTYSNLPPGKYRFYVMSTNNQGSWGDAKIAYEFTIRTPFYQTASFIVAMIILISGIIILALYLRVKQRVNHVMMLERIRAKEQENLRKEIARDFHDEMGNQLTRIINYVSLLKLNGAHANGRNGADCKSPSEVHDDLYSKVENSAKYLYTGTRDFIWSIDPGNDELSKLFIHIRDFGEKLFEEKNIQFRAYNDVKEKIKLPYGFSREANLIFKEIMTNAFKYSCASNVSLSLKRDEGIGFELCFEDDGIGFSTDETSKSNGLQNIKERADKISADLRISSKKSEGTKIILNFKLTKTLKYGLAL